MIICFAICLLYKVNLASYFDIPHFYLSFAHIYVEQHIQCDYYNVRNPMYNMTTVNSAQLLARKTIIPCYTWKRSVNVMLAENCTQFISMLAYIFTENMYFLKFTVNLKRLKINQMYTQPQTKYKSSLNHIEKSDSLHRLF